MNDRNKILYLTTILPIKAITGGELATTEFIDTIRSKGYQVDIVGYSRDNTPAPSGYHSAGVRMIESSFRKFNFWKWMLEAFVLKRPYSAQKYYSEEYKNKVLTLITNNKYSAVIVEHAQLYWILDQLVTFPGDFNVIYNSQNVEFKLYKELELASKKHSLVLGYIYSRESNLMKINEGRMVSSSSEVWCLTENDAESYKSHFGGNKYKVFPLTGRCNDLRESGSTKETIYDIVILGTWTWKPNYAGLMWFIDSVYPFLNENINIAIAGKGGEFLLNKYKNIHYLGFVESSSDFLRAGKCIAVPSTEGGGVQIKTIEAISIGRPVVTTNTGVRGLGNVPDGVHVCDDPVAFAKKIMDVLEADSEDYLSSHAEWIRERKCKFEALIESSLVQRSGVDY